MGAFRFQTVVAQPTQPRAHRHRCERDRRVDDEREHWWAWPVTEMAFAVAPPPVVPPLRPPVALVGWRRRPRATPPRFAVVLAASSGVSGERAPPTFGRLREELLQLHAEADLTQSKGNMAITGMFSAAFMERVYVQYYFTLQFFCYFLLQQVWLP